MAVQNDLGGKRRVPAQLERNVAPLSVQDVERIVIHVGRRRFPGDSAIRVDVPHWRRRAAHQDQEQAFLNGGGLEVLLADLVLLITSAAVLERGILLSFAQALSRRLKRPAMRIRCLLSSVSSDPVSRRHQTRNPPASCPNRK